MRGTFRECDEVEKLFLDSVRSRHDETETKSEATRTGDRLGRWVLRGWLARPPAHSLTHSLARSLASPNARALPRALHRAPLEFNLAKQVWIVSIMQMSDGDRSTTTCINSFFQPPPDWLSLSSRNSSATPTVAMTVVCFRAER